MRAHYLRKRSFNIYQCLNGKRRLTPKIVLIKSLKEVVFLKKGNLSDLSRELECKCYVVKKMNLPLVLAKLYIIYEVNVLILLLNI